MRLTGILASLALVGSTALVAQQPAVFRSENNYVEVDAIVTDRQGNFVSGLTAADFEVSEIGKPQQISTFSVVNLPTNPNAPASDVIGQARVRPDLPLPAAAFTGRIYLLFLDSSWSTPESLYVLRNAKQFVQEFMLPSDVAAVWDARYLNDELTFTNDRAALLRAISSSPTMTSMWPAGSEPQGQFAATRFRTAFDWLGSIQGRRKSLILFTDGRIAGGGFRRPDDRNSAEEWLRTGRIYNDAWGTWLTPTEFAGRSDVHVYPVDARGLIAMAPMPGSDARDAAAAGQAVAAQYGAVSDSVWTLRDLAEQTGGHALVNTNDYREGFRAIVSDNSRYYLLGYDSALKLHDRQFIALNVRMKRPDLVVRARQGYIAR